MVDGKDSDAALPQPKPDPTPAQVPDPEPVAPAPTDWRIDVAEKIQQPEPPQQDLLITKDD